MTKEKEKSEWDGWDGRTITQPKEDYDTDSPN